MDSFGAWAAKARGTLVPKTPRLRIPRIGFRAQGSGLRWAGIPERIMALPAEMEVYTHTGKHLGLHGSLPPPLARIHALPRQWLHMDLRS